MMMNRSIFDSWFPSNKYHLYIDYSCARTVAYEKSIACSTAKALEWDESFKNNTDESGRCILGVHEESREMNPN